jgi:hypothetical protein
MVENIHRIAGMLRIEKFEEEHGMVISSKVV